MNKILPFLFLVFFSKTIIGQSESKSIEDYAFITTWKTDNPGMTEDNQISIPLYGGPYDVDWGDGNVETDLFGKSLHTYESPGVYEVSVTGSVDSIKFNSYLSEPVEENEDATKLLEINQWGDIKWKTMLAAFAGCVNMDVVAEDTPDLSEAASLFSMFTYCSSLKGNDFFNLWDVSTITDMIQVFSQCNNFNADISSWDVSNVTSMSNLFSNAFVFNGDISNWDVSKVGNMNLMFSGATSFNQEIGNWDVSNVTDMTGMFQFSNFNKDISGWDVSTVVNMRYMFNLASEFNQNIGVWNTSNVENMRNMFSSTESFNQDISGWDVSKVTDMRGMFYRAASFDYSLAKWDISNVGEMATFLNESGLSDENYNKTLLGWNQLQLLQEGVTLDALQNQYCEAAVARQNIIDTHEWTINDAGLFCEDTTVPELTILGDNPLIIIEGDEYVDPGATAEDETDGDITASIVIGGDIVDINNPNTYLVTYNVMDLAGNPAEEKVRQVIVEPVQNMELSVIGFSLVDAENDVVLFPITDGMVIDTNTLPTTSLNIVANTTDDTESVLLDLSGAKTAKRIENVAPYALFGDSGSNYKGDSFDLGEYVISATPYANNGLKGNEGVSMSIAFSFQENLVCSSFNANVNDFEGPTSCEGTEGYIDIDVFGATLPVSYELVGVSGPQSSSLFEGLAAGEYTIVVTDMNNCSETLMVTLLDPAKPIVDLDPFNTVFNTDTPFLLTGGMPLGGVYSGQGVNGGFFEPITVGVGTYEITYTFVDPITGCNNSATQNIEVSSENTNTITGFVLVNADTDTDIMILTEGVSIDINDLPTTNLNIRAEATEDVESTLLQITGSFTNTRKENVAPYTFFGDGNGNYYGRILSEGDYNISATPYTGNKLSGEMGNNETISFSIISSSQALTLGIMKIYPNPANFQAKASFDTKDNDIEQIMIFDMLGRLVKVYDGKQVKDGESYLLDVDEFPVGTYFIRTEDANGTQYQKQIAIKR
ncbi:BspA family leucine-rich repeat surface protein [Flagellimonas eckloniae]|uniref:BspA family leucine-rich repeat surface protein n=1 Tax=Flagellimonas eckloniae TaxID=346185 RepID=UPI0006DC54FE|nr:BspA family leucine-rich repeat surface protein [Allomuricauda eckloniae]